MQGDEDHAKESPGGLKEHRGAPNATLAGGAVALLLTAEHSALHTLGSRMCAD